MRLIDADGLFNWGDKQLKDAVKYGNKTADQQSWSYSTLMMYEVADEIEDAPTIDAEPVKHGKWLTTDAYPHHLYCSACYKTYLANNEWLDTLDVPTNYCPNCGAKMDEEE